MMLPDPRPILDLIEAFRRSKVMFAAVKLGVFDATPATAATLSAELPATAPGSDELSLSQLLDACVALGLLTKTGGVYSNTPECDVYLRRASSHSLAGYILYSNDVLWRLWDHLEDAVQEGSHRWPQAFGTEGPIFSHFFRTDEAMRTFLLGLHGLGLLSSPLAVSAHDLSAYRTFVDIGGGTGHLALAFLARYPNAQATVFDLPQVIPLTREVTAGQVECIAGDFFTDPLPPADCYALARILHDWDDGKCGILLRKVYEALPPGGGLLICETLLNEERNGPVSAYMQSLSMLVCTEGRERTAGEYTALLESAGFSHVTARRTGAPVDSILAVK